MKILYHHRTQAEDAQGVHIYEIIHALRHQGHEVIEVALVPAEKGPHVNAKGKEKGRLWSIVSKAMPNVGYEIMGLAYNLAGYLKLVRAIRRFGPDFVYERYALYSACGVWATHRHHIPLILEVNAPLSLEQDKLGKLVFKKLARRTERWICSNSSRTIAVSTPLKDLLVEMGVPAEHIEVVSNGVNTDHFDGRSDGAVVRARYGLEGMRTLGFTGWIREWHGLSELVSQMGEWDEKLADVHLLIVGDGPARAAVEASAAKAGVASRVHITGPVERADMPEHIAAFDIALQPAATTYASPMKVMEYLAMGKPVLACRQPNLQEILTEDVNGLFFTTDDPRDLGRVAHTLLSDPERLRRLSKGASESIHKRGFLWSENAKRAVQMARTAKASRDHPGDTAAGNP